VHLEHKKVTIAESKLGGCQKEMKPLQRRCDIHLDGSGQGENVVQASPEAVWLPPTLLHMMSFHAHVAYCTGG
jgi:hypothetical protein